MVCWRSLRLVRTRKGIEAEPPVAWKEEGIQRGNQNITHLGGTYRKLVISETLN